MSYRRMVWKYRKRQLQTWYKQMKEKYRQWQQTDWDWEFGTFPNQICFYYRTDFRGNIK